MTMDETALLLDAEFWISVSAIAALLILSGFFSGSETALTAASRGKLRAQADKGSRGAQRALDVTEDSERLIGSVLLGNNLVNILATSLTTALLARSFGESAVVLATLVMTVLVLIFAEVLPKTYAITNAERAASLVSRPIQIVTLIFNPIVSAVRWVVRMILRLFGVQTDPDTNVLAVREEIAGALKIGHSEGIVEKEDRDRILGALDLADRTDNPGDLISQVFGDVRNLGEHDLLLALHIGVVDVEVKAAPFERLGQLTGVVRGEEHQRNLLGLDGAELGDRHLVVGEDLEQQRLGLDLDVSRLLILLVTGQRAQTCGDRCAG